MFFVEMLKYCLDIPDRYVMMNNMTKEIYKSEIFDLLHEGHEYVVVDHEQKTKHIGHYLITKWNSAKYGVWHPTLMGSSRCMSGSVASGGLRVHCSCNTCF